MRNKKGVKTAWQEGFTDFKQKPSPSKQRLLDKEKLKKG